MKINIEISLPFPLEDKLFASNITAKMRPWDPLLSCWFAVVDLIHYIYHGIHFQEISQN